MLPFENKRDWFFSSTGAIFIHAMLFLGSSFAFIQPPQYGIEASSGGIEISLIAALPATSVGDEMPEKEEAETIEEDAERVLDPTLKSELAQKAASEMGDAQKKNYSFVNNTPFVGDGSSETPGQSRTTFYSPGGGSTETKEGYLKNPPPPYPQEAVHRGQEGLVVLTVYVDKSGRTQDVEIKQSSGYRLLDQSALKTVRRWRFDPAHIGMLRTDAKIDIPIRFVLEEELRRLRGEA